MNLLMRCYKNDLRALPDAWRRALPSSQKRFLHNVVLELCDCSDDGDDLNPMASFELRVFLSMLESR